jgi:alcohol dehydrogenase
VEIKKFAIPEIIFGRGSLQVAGLCARRLGPETALLVSDSGLEQVGWVSRVKEILESENLRWVHYSNVVSNPRDHQIEEGAEP